MELTQGLALILSMLLEVPLVLGFGAAMGLLRGQVLRWVIVGCAATLLTHPFAWHGFALLRPYVNDLWLRTLIIEGGVAVVEGLLYAWLVGAGLARGQLLGWSANAFSYGVGLVLLRTVFA